MVATEISQRITYLLQEHVGGYENGELWKM